MFSYSNVYYFRYNPIGATRPPILPIFDQFPLVIFLEIRGMTALGVNLHWIPVPLRVKFIQLILEMRERSFNKSFFRMWYTTIKYNIALAFTLTAIRKYYIGRCSGIQVIPPEEWPNLPVAWATRYRARYMRRSLSNPTRHI